MRPVAIALVIGACSSSFRTAEHPSVALGNIPNNGGPILAHLKLVTISFAGFARESEAHALGKWIPTSGWLTSAGAEYGIGAGTDAGHLILQEPAPSTVTLADVGAFVAARIRNGTLPSDSDRALEAGWLYVVFYPASTNVHVVASDAGCAAAGGFHASYSNAGLLFAFAAIPDACAGSASKLGLDAAAFLEVDASHEIIEAASNPYFVATDGMSVVSNGPSAWHLGDEKNPWSAFGGEIGDACTFRAVRDSGFSVQRIWSNRAASMGADPCQPAVGTSLGVSPADDAPLEVAAGATAQLGVTGWSSAPTAAWNVRAYTAPLLNTTLVPQASIAPASFDNAATGTLSVTIPAGTPSGSNGAVFIESVPVGDAQAYSSWSLWPVLVRVR